MTGSPDPTPSQARAARTQVAALAAHDPTFADPARRAQFAEEMKLQIVVIHAGRSAILSLTLASSANAQGFAINDLSTLGADAAKALGTGYDHRSARNRVTLSRPTCSGEPVIYILLGQQADGTEDRVRSGATSIADLQTICRARSPTCRVSALSVTPAIGWVSAYPLGPGAGATAIVMREGDLLTVRSLARHPATARRSIDRLFPLLCARVVGL